MVNFSFPVILKINDSEYVNLSKVVRIRLVQTLDDDNNASTPNIEVGDKTMGRAYVTYRLTSSKDAACTFAIDKVTVPSEF